MAQKLWRVSRVLNRSPFSDEVLNHTEAQFDFILEMDAADNPEGPWKFIRPGEDPPPPANEIQAQWEARLLGRARKEFLAPLMPSKAVLEAAEKLKRAQEFLVKGANVGSGVLKSTP